jgi:iron complex outermembrane receptor protein
MSITTSAATRRPLVSMTSISVMAWLAITPAAAQQATPVRADSTADIGIAEIVVTAQKRSENINDVPLSITAASADELIKRGVTDVAGLAKVVPGLQFTESFTGTPIYTLRGIGFYDVNFTAGSTVAIYVDEVPLPFTVQAQMANLDLERVEVLKGPQGTLFGQNATGGSINYIAAKPTSTAKAGFDLSANNFGQVDASGFVSGPLSDTVRARVAVSTVQFGAWQKSVSRNDKLGDQNRLAGRLLLDFTPSDRLSFRLNVNGWQDKSETQAAQFLALNPNVPGILEAFYPAYLGLTPAPRDNRKADWTPGFDLRRDASQFQASLRSSLDVTDQLQLVSISNYIKFSERRSNDPDGTTLDNVRFDLAANLETFSQELRLVGDFDRVSLIAGVNYDRTTAEENDATNFVDASVTPLFSVFPSSAGKLFQNSPYFSNQRYRNAAVFGNVDLRLTDQIILHGGARYTEFSGRAEGCTLDSPNNALSGGLGDIFNSVRGSVGYGPTTFPVGGCVTSNDSNPADPQTFLVPGIFVSRLKEHNVSWRAGVDFKPADRVLVYASASKGFKAGQFPTLQANLFSQLRPATQESVLSYELGFKLGLSDRTLQLNGAVFHYDYSNKQFRGRIFDPIFGPVETLINVSDSRVRGAELQVTWAPTRGFLMTVGGSYLDSKVASAPKFNVYDPLGAIIDITDSPFPYTPKWQITGDAEYRWSVGGRLEAFAGVSGYYQSETASTFADRVSGTNPLYTNKAYATLDLRAGVTNPNAGWTLSLFGRNVTDTYYWTNATRILDTSVRITGRPATYGASFSARF